MLPPHFEVISAVLCAVGHNVPSKTFIKWFLILSVTVLVVRTLIFLLKASLAWANREQIEMDPSKFTWISFFYIHQTSAIWSPSPVYFIILVVLIFMLYVSFKKASQSFYLLISTQSDAISKKYSLVELTICLHFMNTKSAENVYCFSHVYILNRREKAHSYLTVLLFSFCFQAIPVGSVFYYPC